MVTIGKRKEHQKKSGDEWWKEINYLFRRKTSGDLGCRSVTHRPIFASAVEEIGGRFTGEVVPAGQIFDLSGARTPNGIWKKTGQNKVTGRDYEYWGVMWEVTPYKVFGSQCHKLYASSGSDPRHQYDGVTKRII